jgi:hypothetical protein
MIGALPDPYDPKVIGLPEDPEFLMFSCSRQVSPLLKRMELPGENEDAFTFAIVRHAVVGDCPLLLSLPADAST